MQPFVSVLGKKPVSTIIILSLYIALAAFLRWRFVPAWDMMWFVLGGLVGMYFFDVGEWFFNLSPSPFRTPLFILLFSISSLFIVTSATSSFGIGVVLAMYADLALRIWRDVFRPTSYPHWMPADIVLPGRVSPRSAAIVFIGIFLFETVLFIR